MSLYPDPTENYPHGRATIRQAVDFVDSNEHRVFNRVVLVTENGEFYTYDDYSGALTTITFAHHELHEGHHFQYANAQDLTNAQTISFTLVTPDTTRYANFGFELNGESEYDMQLFEGAAGLTSVGTPVTNPAVINNDRNSATTNTMVINSGPTLGAGSKGTLIKRIHIGSGRGVGGVSGTDQEIILKRNTIYWVDITNATATNNFLSWIVSWYEHQAGS